MRNHTSHNILECCGCLFLAAALFLVPAHVCFAGNFTKTVEHYTVSSLGFTVGDVTTTQRMTEEGGVPCVQFETRTAVKASFLWMGYSLETIEKGTLQKAGLVSYSRKGRDNGATIDIEGRLEDSSFRFDVHENGVARSVVIPRSSYDYTTMECPEARIGFSEKPQITLRVLDVGKMTVVKRDYRLVRNAYYTVAGKEYPCRIVDFSDRNKKARRWIFWDGSAVIMYRQDSKGEKESYSVRATSVTKGM